MLVKSLQNPAHMIVRHYNRAKCLRVMGGVSSVMNLMIGVNNAKNNHLSNMLISYGCTCLCLKITHACHQMVKSLKPEYMNILKRAKQIYKHK